MRPNGKRRLRAPFLILRKRAHVPLAEDPAHHLRPQQRRLFVWRLAWNWSGRKASGIRRWGPHLVDTLLLLSALGLVHLAMPWPLPLWLLAKLGLLLGYIVCAAFALRMARG